MQSLKCSLSLVVALGLCHMCMAMPGRYIRASDDGSLIQLQLTDDVNDLNPINAEVCYKFNSILLFMFISVCVHFLFTTPICICTCMYVQYFIVI